MTKPHAPAEATKKGSRISVPSRVILALCSLALAGAVFSSWVLSTRGPAEWIANLFNILVLGGPIFLLLFTGIMVWASLDLWGFVEHRTRVNVVIALVWFVCLVSSAWWWWDMFTRMLCSDCVR
jgi:hypothetical protein